MMLVSHECSIQPVHGTAVKMCKMHPGHIEAYGQADKPSGDCRRIDQTHQCVHEQL